MRRSWHGCDIVRQYQELDNEQASKDPYCKFPLLAVQLFSQQFLAGERVIWAQNIHSHFASCPYESWELKGKFLVALSLNHVSGFASMNLTAINTINQN